MNASARPTVSVIMAAYNGAQTIRASVDSILAQTLDNLELVITDDGSTDDTLAILEAVADPRLRILRNEANRGVVASRNRCFENARGRYVAILDCDDLSAPTRLARQVAYLDENPGVVLLGTEARILDGGTLRRMNHPSVTTPGLIGWLLKVVNPLVCSSIMFRAETARQLGEFMRESYMYAEDYDFYVRMAALGGIARLDDVLTLYRLHANNISKRQEQAMMANAVRVLEPAYGPLFGPDAQAAAKLIVSHLAAGKPVEDVRSLRHLAKVFETLNESFLAAPDTDATTAALLRRHARLLWLRMLRTANRHRRVSLAELRASQPAGSRIGTDEVARMVLERSAMRGGTREMLRRVLPSRTTSEAAPGELFGRLYLPRLPDPESPPTLFVVVDTEAEFDWDKPFARELTAVSAVDNVEQGQAIFDRYGLRPIYVIDYPVASQASSQAKLRAILDRGGCEIGAHLHPWTTPPLVETVSTRNSYPGNLDADLEERKLATLMDTIRNAFGVSPVFYKAGRYGFGRATPATLVRHGIRVDLSVLPGADLRRKGGPDFRRLKSIPYQIAGTPILSIPMTRSAVGLIPSLDLVGQVTERMPGGKLLHIPSFLARLRLAETITLTPEGVTAGEQIRLLRAMLSRGCRQFVLHYHSPSLSPGHTPYVRDAAGLDVFLARLRDVCRFFFEDLGGLPGHPHDLLRFAETAICAVQPSLSNTAKSLPVT